MNFVSGTDGHIGFGMRCTFSSCRGMGLERDEQSTERLGCTRSNGLENEGGGLSCSTTKGRGIPLLFSAVA